VLQTLWRNKGRACHESGDLVSRTSWPGLPQRLIVVDLFAATKTGEDILLFCVKLG
jgi:hypothetical protein